MQGHLLWSEATPYLDWLQQELTWPGRPLELVWENQLLGAAWVVAHVVGKGLPPIHPEVGTLCSFEIETIQIITWLHG